MKKNYFIKGLSILFLSLFVSATNYAQLGTDTFNIASDSGSDYTSGTWLDGSNLGTGFGNWTLTQSANNAGRYIGGTGQGTDSFGLFSENAGNFSAAERTFLSDLKRGETISVNIGHTTTINGEVFLQLLDDGVVVFTLKFVGGTSDWQLNDGGSDFAIAQPYAANTSLAFSFTYNEDGTYSYTFGSASGNNFSPNNTISGINSIKFQSTNQGGGQNFGFNNLNIESKYTITGNSTVASNSDITIPYLDVHSGSTVNIENNVSITNDLKVSGTINISSGSSMIVGGTSTGNVTYNRTLNFVSGNTNGWHLVSSPVAGETFDNTFATNNDIASGTSTNLGVASYNTTGNTWTYLQSPSGSISSTSGTGYSMKRASTGTVSFTGTINTSDVNGVSVGTDDGGFNLLGNPYTAYMSSQTFLNANTNTTGQIWTWTDGAGYTARTAEDNFTIAPGQGFFVSVTSGSTVDFAASNQASGTDNFQKNDKTEISLSIANGKLKRAARLMYFDENVTKGFDWGYEGKTFTGVKSKMEVFTHILENNIGESYQVQSLPKNEMETMIVPVGITADAGKITFSAEATNLPNGLKVFLEDRENGTFTRLDETNTDYTVTLTEKTDGVGRFYLHTKSSALSTESFKMDNISMYPTNTTNLRIVGLSQGKANIKLFNILGKQVVNKSFSSNGAYDVTLPKLTTGVYIAQLENENGKISKKIILE